MIIDIHTHAQESRAALSFYNLTNSLVIPHTARLVSAGLHPWYLKENTLSENISSLEILAQDSRVRFIGECGLDKVCRVDFDLQLRAFRMQIELANHLSKPLIIHCVRAHNEVIKVLADCKNAMPVIFHGFNKNYQIATAILAKGYYLSFGSELHKESVATVFSTIPVNRIFLESDDAETDIHSIYNKAAEIKEIAVDDLEAQIGLNLRTILGPEFKAV